MLIEKGVEGFYDDRFMPLVESFHQNFTDGREVGASLCVIQNGEILVDLWSGLRDVETAQPWEENTIVNVFSTTKMITALCVLVLVERGQIDLDEPLAAYWTEFGNRGKEKILVRHVLSHTAGLPGFSQAVAFEDLFDWGKMIHILEAEKPWWKPGSKLGYLTLTYGYLLGEIVRRVSGKSLGKFLRDEITAPLGIDFFIGLPEGDEARVAALAPAVQEVKGWQMALVKLLFPVAAKIMGNPPLDTENFNTRACRAAEIPAGNGMGNARSVAQLGSILANGGMFGEKRILSHDLVEQVLAQQVRGKDPIAFGRDSAWGLGVMLHNPSLLLGQRSFYATGMGGSVCVMDRERRVTLAYVMNKMAELSEGDSRSIPLMQCMWNCLDAEK